MMHRNESPSSSPRRARLLWGGIAGLFGLLHLFVNALHLADRELWLDEASTYGVAAQSFWRNLTLPIEFHSQPPLYYVVLHCLIPLNSSEWFLRGFSWLMMLGLILLALLGLDELKLPQRAFLAFLLVYGSFTLYLAQELRPYALSALTTFAATILFLRALRAPSRRRALLYAAVAVPMLYTLAFDLWVFAAQGLFLAGIITVRCLRRGPRATFAELRPLLVAFVAVAVAYLPYLILAYRWQFGSGSPSWSGSWQAMTSIAPYTETIQSFMPIGFPYSLALCGLVLMAVIAGLRERRADFVLWLLIVVGQIAFVQGFLTGRSFIATRYYTPAYPAFLFLIVLGARHAFNETRWLWRVAPVVLGLLVWDRSRPFVASARAPLDDGRWRALHHELVAVPGRKVVFFDIGYNGQVLQYEARHDRDIVLALQKGPGWAAGGDNHLDPAYIKSTIAREAPTTRCFYYVIAKSPGPYHAVFLPAMERLGYREAPSPGEDVSCFCQP